MLAPFALMQPWLTKTPAPFQADAQRESPDANPSHTPPAPSASSKLRTLVGSGDKIGLFALPFLLIGLVLNLSFPATFSVGGPPALLKGLSCLVLVPGIVIWIWSALLILVKVPRGELITHGPYALVKHPLYTGVALLVVPWLGFLLDTWLGAVVGLALYGGSRLFAREEERALARAFGAAWDAYCRRVMLPWL